MQIIAKEVSPTPIAADDNLPSAPAGEAAAAKPVAVESVAAPDTDPAKTAALALEFGL